jgi:predicted N-acyltransferase
MAVQIAHSIHHLSEASWDVLAADDLGLTHRWLRVMERCRRNYRPRYLLIEDRRGPLAAAVMDTSAHFGRGGWRELLMRRTTLVLSAPFSAMSSGVALRQGTTLCEALPALERGLDTLCRQEWRPLLCVSNVTDADLPSWRARGFIASAQDPGMLLDLAAPSYEAYCAALPSRHRQELRRARHRGEAYAVHINHEPHAEDGDQLYAQLCEVFVRHGTPAHALPFTPDLLDALERELRDELLVLRGYVGGTFAGFILCIKLGQKLWCPMLGMRHDLARPSYLYFLLLDAMIHWGFEHGVQRIYAGLSNERQKERHGFQRQSRWFCYRAAPRPCNDLLTVALPLARRLFGRTAGGSSAPPQAAGTQAPMPALVKYE